MLQKFSPFRHTVTCDCDENLTELNPCKSYTGKVSVCNNIVIILLF